MDVSSDADMTMLSRPALLQAAEKLRFLSLENN